MLHRSAPVRRLVSSGLAASLLLGSIAPARAAEPIAAIASVRFEPSEGGVQTYRIGGRALTTDLWNDPTASSSTTLGDRPSLRLDEASIARDRKTGTALLWSGVGVAGAGIATALVYASLGHAHGNIAGPYGGAWMASFDRETTADPSRRTTEAAMIVTSVLVGGGLALAGLVLRSKSDHRPAPSVASIAF